MRFAAVLLAFSLSAAAQPEPQKGQLDGSKAVFAVLAAVNAAGFDTDLDSASNHPLRKALRELQAREAL